jgi:GTP-binding protein
VAVVLVDAQEGLLGQDQRILEEVIANRRAAVLAVNKWDLIEKDAKTADQYTKAINAILAKYAYLPVIYISALTGQRVTKVITEVKKVYDESHKRIPTAQLNEFLQRALQRRHPPAKQGKHIKFNYVAQTEVAPPTFVFFTNHPKLVDKTYISYLSNQLRSAFGFAGVPFRLKFRRK